MQIEPTKLRGTVSVPSSKSISHRALILAALGKPGSTISDILSSEDVLATKECLEQMGAEFKQIDNSWEVVTRANQGSLRLNCKNSGTSLRLLTGIASIFPQQSELFGDESLNQRPMGPLVAALEKLGATIVTDQGKPPVKVLSPVRSQQKETEIRGDVSSQFISSLLIMAAVRGENRITRIRLIPPIVSKPYINLTVQLLHQLGVEVDVESEMYSVKGQNDFGKVHLSSPADFSSAAFMIVAGALPGNKVIIENLDFDYPQADAKVLDFVREAGADVIVEDNKVIVEGGQLHGFNADLSDCPDLFPILCTLAALSKGKSKLYNAKHLRIKETDRIATMTTNLRSVGIEVEELEDGAIVYGGSVKGSGQLKSFGDHRIAMASAVLATQADEGISIDDAECVAVSYPDFFDHLQSLYTSST